MVWANAARQHSMQDDSVIGKTMRACILLCEPDELTKWSVSTYLQRWFDVQAASSPDDARARLEQHPCHAVIISDELRLHDIEEIERLARTRNPGVMTVRTVSSDVDLPHPDQRTIRLEKPFNLASLACALGIAPDADTTAQST